MKRVMGIGGVFIRAKTYDVMREWYKVHGIFWITDSEGNRIELWEPPKANTQG